MERKKLGKDKATIQSLVRKTVQNIIKKEVEDKDNG
tara:strand:- start:87 stop:194 length:108 start_codon:yes stop_codon:yes gene_type:complete